MDYINPFSAMSGDSSIESPFLRSYDRQNRQNLAMPFIDMAQQKQQMDLQQEAAKNAEWASPLAVQTRQSGLQKDLTTNQETIRGLPWKTDAEISNAKATIQANPAITQQKIAEAEQAAIKARGTPSAEFFNEVASINEAIKKLPEGARPLAAQQYIEQFKARHPGAKIPKIMESYDSTSWDLASLVAVNNAEYQRKLKEQEAKDTAHMARTEKEIAGRERVAEIGADSRETVAATRASGNDRAPKTDAEAFHKNQPKLLSPDTPPEEKARAAAAMQPHIITLAAKQAKEMGLDIVKDKTSIMKLQKTLEDSFGVTEALIGSKPAPKGATINVNGKVLELLGTNADGSKRVRDPKTGQTGTVK